MKKLVFTALAVGLSFTASFMAQVPNYVPTNGLVGWWPFNSNANDESGNGNNGTVNGATLTTDRFGLPSKCMFYNGVSNYIDLPIISTSSDFSFSLWFNATEIKDWLVPVNNHIPGMIISKFTNTQSFPNGWESGVDPLTNLLGVGNGSTGVVANNQVIDTLSWYSLICSYTSSNSTMKMYLNGSLANSNTSFQNVNNNVTVRLGARSNSTAGFFFHGKIDDIGIWNRALSDQEISDLYNGNICYEFVTVTDTLVINTGITGYNPITYLNTLKIWPNPTNDHITIDAGNLATMNGYSIKIEDAQGQQVFQNAVNQQQFYVDITTWGGNGLYFVHLIDPQNNTVTVRKIVLQ